ncbi:hypothetical protein Rhopal_004174-T1 [Rhodotorula paludigena]|uniref:UDP-N-acetylglucosamine transferase subunit ALG13 n=1 Tax=Rhodotorula paludigena TaxID=86838 RepID=A0AAV5GF34_9BASI|nr:hypothetical protein Rhopal_004174-T1 [Rhodotorula paludigena]
MSGPPKLSFGLNKAALPRQAPKKPAKGKPVFGGADDDDDEGGALPPAHLDTSRSKNRPAVSTASLSRAQKAKQQEELALDSSVYEYDEVWDNMKAAEKAAQSERKKESGERKPKYISRLMETAEIRKQDRLRAEDKMIQREREREGDEFADKDAFVTEAYKKQQEELRVAEEEEKKREEAQKNKNGGLTSFMKSYLDSTEAAHAAAVAGSSAKVPLGPARPTEAERAKTDAELAAEHEAKTGRRVEVNEDGEIVDRRQLMSGGLNIVAKPKPGAASSGFAVPIAARAPPAKEDRSAAESLLHPGVSHAERVRQSRERQSRMIEQQMVELEERRKREAEEALEHKVQKVAKRNDEDRVAALKRAAEERRKKRAKEAKAAGSSEHPSGLQVEVVRFLDDLEGKVGRADVVVSHAGAGSILSFLRPLHTSDAPSKSPRPRQLVLVPNSTLMDSHHDLPKTLEGLMAQAGEKGEIAQPKYPELDKARVQRILDETLGFA